MPIFKDTYYEGEPKIFKKIKEIRKSRKYEIKYGVPGNMAEHPFCKNLLENSITRYLDGAPDKTKIWKIIVLLCGIAGLTVNEKELKTKYSLIHRKVCAEPKLL